MANTPDFTNAANKDPKKPEPKPPVKPVPPIKNPPKSPGHCPACGRG